MPNQLTLPTATPGTNPQTSFKPTLPPTDPPTGGGGSGGNGSGQQNQYNNPYNPTGMNPNPSQQGGGAGSTSTGAPNWITGGGNGPGQWNAVNPDAGMAQSFADMQGNVQAGIKANSQKPNRFTVATNDPNVWMSPDGETWITPGYNNGDKGIDPNKTWGSNPTLGQGFYNLPGGTFLQNANTGGTNAPLTQITNPQQAFQAIQSLPNRGGQNDAYAMLAASLAGNTPGFGITNQANYGQAQDAGRALMGLSPAATQLATNATTTNNPLTTAATGSATTPNTNTVGPGGTGGTSSGQDIMRWVNPLRDNPGASGTSNTVNIGGQQMRWDAANQYFVPVNPTPYGQGGGENS